MKEDFVAYVWKFQKWQSTPLITTSGETLEVFSPGRENTNSGPDFFDARLKIGTQKWAGNVEIHTQGKNWFLHKHDNDTQYDSVILHVVWENPVPVYRRATMEEIPTVVLKPYVSLKLIATYKNLSKRNTLWIPCEKQLKNVDSFKLNVWLEKLFVERLEYKSKDVYSVLKQRNGNWEATLFELLCVSFGLKVNSNSFRSLAQSLPFSQVMKIARNDNGLEALFLGQLKLLNESKNDSYYNKLKKEYNYLTVKYRLNNNGIITPKFFRLRPHNFPTIRLAQLAALYTLHTVLFDRIIKAETIVELQKLFQIKLSSYWNTHYKFRVQSKESNRKISNTLFNLIVINTIIPIKLAYQKARGEMNVESIYAILTDIPIEKNKTISKFKSLGVKGESALTSQALLQLFAHYCEPKKCLQCGIGIEILNQNNSET